MGLKDDLLTARLGRPTAQLTKQYTTPTNKWITETKLQISQDFSSKPLSLNAL